MWGKFRVVERLVSGLGAADGRLQGERHNDLAFAGDAEIAPVERTIRLPQKENITRIKSAASAQGRLSQERRGAADGPNRRSS
jgi:hypothetical protein